MNELLQKHDISFFNFNNIKDSFNLSARSTVKEFLGLSFTFFEGNKLKIDISIENPANSTLPSTPVFPETLIQ